MIIWYIDVLCAVQRNNIHVFVQKQARIEVGDKLSTSSTSGKCWEPWKKIGNLWSSGGSDHLHGWRWCNIPF